MLDVLEVEVDGPNDDALGSFGRLDQRDVGHAYRFRRAPVNCLVLQHGGGGVQRHLHIGAELVRLFDPLAVFGCFLVPNDRPARLKVEQVHVPLSGKPIDLEQRHARCVDRAPVHPDGMLDVE